MKSLANLDPKKREQYMMLLCGVILVIAGIPLAFYLYGSEISTMKAKIEATQKSIDELELKELQGLKFERNIRQNAAHALPTDKELAIVEYKNWLSTLCSQFEAPQVANTGSSEQKARVIKGQTGDQGQDTYYTNHKFTVRGKTTLGNLGQFLKRFYEVQTPHRIRNMTITPVDNAQRVDVVMNIEALSIPQTRNKNFVPAKKENDDTSRDRMIATVVGRNFFAPYRQQPPTNPGGNQTQQSQLARASNHTYLNGITWSNDRAQAWFNFRLEGRQAILRVGDRFRIGDSINCQILAIKEDRTVEVRVEARSAGDGTISRSVWSLMPGDTFADAEFLYDIDEEEEAAANADNRSIGANMDHGA